MDETTIRSKQCITCPALIQWNHKRTEPVDNCIVCRRPENQIPRSPPILRRQRAMAIEQLCEGCNMFNDNYSASQLCIKCQRLGMKAMNILFDKTRQKAIIRALLDDSDNTNKINEDIPKMISSYLDKNTFRFNNRRTHR